MEVWKYVINCSLAVLKLRFDSGAVDAVSSGEGFGA